MATATIVYNDDGTLVEMQHWPPDSTLVAVDPPFKTFDRLTGEATEHTHIAVQIPRAGMAETEANVYPTNAAAEFLDPSLHPIATGKSGLLHSVLKALGYEVTN